MLTDELLDDYKTLSSLQERKDLRHLFAVEKIVNARPSKHTVATSLFWKHANESDGDLPELSRELIIEAKAKGLVKRLPPWEHYVQPLLGGAQRLAKARPEIVFRVYLAKDLEFLIPDLVEAGCEVYLMASSSIQHNPGAMWRFLALEEKDRLVTISDADRAPKVESDIQRTEITSKAGLALWRVPVWGDMNDKGMMGYRPILGCQFGSAKPVKIRHLMEALVWHSVRGSISSQCYPPGCGATFVYGTRWPDYGFDEWFLLSALYPRVAKGGIVTFIPATSKSLLLPLDIEYCTWSNPNSEIMYFGPNESCCALSTASSSKVSSDAAFTLVTQEKNDIIAYSYEASSGLGEAAAVNIETMRNIGLSVEHRIWRHSLIKETALSNPGQVFYHHWHPQPADRGTKLPRAAFGNARHIAYYAYETSEVPSEFEMIIDGLEEIWVPSSFCKRLFNKYDLPVHVVPHAVDTPLNQGKGLGASIPTVLFIFDAWSRMARKNPEMVIKVFRDVVQNNTQARLIIKTHNLGPQELHHLHKLCGSKLWITIINEHLATSDLHDLYAQADILLSLQRCEGFGLNLAKAQSYGLPVITTGYGGHLDFCEDSAFLVDYELDNVAKYNDPWYSAGQWANPKEISAGEQLRHVLAAIQKSCPLLKMRLNVGKAVIAEKFSRAVLEKNIANRLSRFFAEHHSLKAYASRNA